MKNHTPNKVDKLGEIKIIPSNVQFQRRLNQELIENLNRPNTSKEIELVKTNKQANKTTTTTKTPKKHKSKTIWCHR